MDRFIYTNSYYLYSSQNNKHFLLDKEYRDLFVWLTGFFTRGQFWPSGVAVACVCVCLCACQSRACPSNNSSTVDARITIFDQKMQNNMVARVPIILRGD